jgi:hypothetical protein
MRLSILLWFLLALMAKAAPITAAWQPSALATSYKLQFTWPTNGTNVVVLMTTNTTATWSNGVAGVAYTVEVFAIRTWVENGVTNVQMSVPSLSVHVTVPDPPNGLQIMMLFNSAPEPTGPWTTQSNLVMFVKPSDPNRFYQIPPITISMIR